MCRSSTAATKAVGLRKSDSPFGIRGREMKRLTQKIVRRQHWLRHRPLAPHRRAAVAAAHHDPTTSLTSTISTARKQELLDGAARRKTQEEEMLKLQQWAEAKQPELLVFLKRMCPQHQWSWADLTAIPDARGHALALTPCTSELVTKALAWASHNRTTNLPASLERQWASIHSVVMDSHAPALQPESKERGDACRKAGVCLCCIEGRQLKQLSLHLLSLMKTAFHTRQQKARLSSGEVVAQAVRRGDCTHTESPEPAVMEVWLHIAHMSFSPYQPSYQCLEKVNDTTCLQPAMQGRLVMKALTLEYHTPGIKLRTKGT